LDQVVQVQQVMVWQVLMALTQCLVVRLTLLLQPVEVGVVAY
jgi:hypothetical protein